MFGPMPLASRVGRESADNVIYWSTYGYVGARAHAQGRGSLGFACFTSYNSETGIRETQYLDHEFPLTGMVRRTVVERVLSGGGATVLSEDVNANSFDTVSINGVNTGSVFPFVAWSTSSKWENDDSADTYDATTKLWTGSNQYSTTKSMTWFDNQNTNVAPPVRTSMSAGTTGLIQYGNIVKIEVISDNGYTATTDDDFTTTTLNTYLPVNTSGKWILGRLATAEVTSSNAPGPADDITRHSGFEYYADSGLLAREIVEPSAGGGLLVKEYLRDDFGNIYVESVSGKFGARSGVNNYSDADTVLVTRSDPDSTKRFYGAVTNALGQTEKSEFDFWGRKILSEGPNGLVTQWSYLDPFGVHVLEFRPDGTVAETNAEILPAGEQRFTVISPTDPAAVPSTVTYALSEAHIVKTVSASGSPTARVYYDRFGREIRAEADGFGTAVIRKDTLYDRYGRGVAVSEKYYANPGARPVTGLPVHSDVLWSTSQYDSIGRVSSVTAPNGSVTQYDYRGRVSRVTRDAQTGGKAQTQTTLANAIGKTVSVWNANRNTSGINHMGLGAAGAASVTFTYDAIGNLVRTVADNATTTMSYDHAGNKIGMNDPDMGAWSYEYDALGRLRFQTDAIGNTTQMSYDALGRLQKRVVREGGNGDYEVTCWEYDGAGMFDWIGALRREYVLNKNNGSADADVLDQPTAAQIRTQHGMQYDEFGRLMVDLRQVDGKWYYNYTRYDAYGRVASVNYFWRPAGKENTPTVSASNWQSFGLSYEYDYTAEGDGVGFLIGITDHYGRNWWSSPSYDQEGRVVRVLKGTVWTQRCYREEDGSIASIISGFSQGAAQLQDLAYTFDTLGNLASRTDAYRTHQNPLSLALSETFGYDELNRVVTRGNGTIIATYADNGNILTKRDVSGTLSSVYDYDVNQRVHAVTSAWDYTMRYDANGRLYSREKAGGPVWSFGWTPTNMVRSIFAGDDGSEYQYDGSDSRIVEIRKVAGQEVEKKIFCPGFEQFFEKETGNSEWTAKLIRVHIAAPDGVVGVFEYMPGKTDMSASQSLTLLFTDHLGSVDLAINIAGGMFLNFAVSSTRTKYSYDAWGQRRDETDWVGAHELTTAELAAQHTDRGFTGHEMLDELGLVNMNARIYDPLLGRFLSADTIVPHPSDLQSYNRYSYCDNNPLSRIDPSGHGWLSKMFHSIGKFVKKFFAPIVAVVITVATCGGGLFLLSLNLSSITSVFVAGYVISECCNKSQIGTIITIAFSMMGMPFVGGLVGSAVQTAISGGSVSDFLIGMVVGSIAGYAAGPISGSIARSMGLAARDIAFSLVRGAISGALSGAMSAIVYGRKIWEGIRSGMCSGMVTSAVFHLYRSYQTEKFIRNHLDSDDYSKEFLDVIRDVGQSPSGSRVINGFISDGKVMNLRLDPNDFVGNTCSMAKDVHGNIINDHILYSKYDWTPTSFAHEIGHTTVGGFNNMSDIDAVRESEKGAVQNFDNTWRWWMGKEFRTRYDGLGESSVEIVPSSDPNMLDTFKMNFGPMDIPSRSFIDQLLHPGY